MAMEMKSSPVCRLFSAPLDSEGYHTCYLLDSTGAEPDFPAGRSHTAPNAELAHDAEREALTRRFANAKDPRHTEFRMMGPEAGDLGVERRTHSVGMKDTEIGVGGERGAPGGPLCDCRD